MNPPEFAALAQAEIDRKTKPPGSLGQLEAWAVQLAVLQKTLEPRLDRGRILIFGADHGLAAEGISAYPPQVTREMMRNFAAGGAAITVLSRSLGLDVEVLDVGVAADLEDLAGIVHAKVAFGTVNMLHGPAMDEDAFSQAWQAGEDAAARVAADGIQAVGLGEMGIGNTTSASLILSALTGHPPEQTVGRGTGVDDAQLAHKRQVVEAVLARHAGHLETGRNVLQRLGGFEIVALASAATHAARRGLAVIIDGFISTAGALAAVHMDPAIRPALFFAHRSAESGHRLALEALDATPMLDLDMRLGEGTGAALAFPLLQSAAAILREMATFESAGVSSRA